MDPLTLLILTAVAQIVIDVVVQLLHLAFARLAEWFVSRQAQVAGNPNRMAVTVAESLRSGDFAVVQGIFDQYTGNFVGQPRRVRAGSADPQVSWLHSGNRVAVWT
ncbi:hypothetical protein ACGFNU_23800 [Spirillospora sp. NPDC048911]|uniref:hypothetical protein n=1 Tax=Spirillospora sp. NPDC048911 TaxID=3364527 RepID=UPI0037128D9F